jgi:hypothetical protein
VPDHATPCPCSAAAPSPRRIGLGARHASDADTDLTTRSMTQIRPVGCQAVKANSRVVSLTLPAARHS